MTSKIDKIAFTVPWNEIAQERKKKKKNMIWASGHFSCIQKLAVRGLDRNIHGAEKLQINWLKRR